MRNLRISVVIPTSGPRSPVMLERTLLSLTNEILPSELVDIIVVENGDDMRVQDICHAYSSRLPIKYYFSPIPNLSNARNIGIKNSSSDVIIFFDDDLRFSGKTLQAYANAFRSSESNCFFGGPLDIDYEKTPSRVLIDFFPASVRGYLPGDDCFVINSPSQQLFLGGNHAIPKSLIEKYNGYDLLGASGLNEGYLGEETRLQEKMLKDGCVGLFVPEAKVWHYVPQESVTFSWLLKRYYRRGVTEGFLLKNSTINVKEIIGIPRYAIIKIMREIFGILLVWRYLSSPKSYVANILNAQITRGTIAGYMKTKD